MTGDWTVLETVVEYETDWYTGGYDLLEQPDGSTKRYYWAELPPAVVVVAERNGEILFVEQFRPAVGETFLELPAGLVENDESYESAGVRELAEETGFHAAESRLLQEYWVATGVLRHRRGVVVAADLTPGSPSRDGNEFLEVSTHPVSEALDIARSAPANESTLSALLLAAADGHFAPDQL